MFKEEGLGSFYRALPPRLCSVTPMIGIQFAVYELMKRILLKEPSSSQGAAGAAALSSCKREEDQKTSTSSQNRCPVEPIIVDMEEQLEIPKDEVPSVVSKSN